jgi:hypothetical protein
MGDFSYSSLIVSRPEISIGLVVVVDWNFGPAGRIQFSGTPAAGGGIIITNSYNIKWQTPLLKSPNRWRQKIYNI